MKLPEFIHLAQEAPALGFLLIGGYAVGVHGYTRPTFDVDFLARRSELTQWKRRLTGAGLSLFAERTAFAQFSQGGQSDGLDLMLVDDPTFERMLPSAVTTPFDDASAPVVSLDQLLMLKLHVLRQALPHRTGKDAEDVEMLLRRNKVPLENDHYRTLFLTYGNPLLYTPSDASSDASEPALRNPEPISFPVDEDPSFNPPLVSLQVMMERSADLRRWLPRGIPTDEERLATKCDVVFRW